MRALWSYIYSVIHPTSPNSNLKSKLYHIAHETSLLNLNTSYLILGSTKKFYIMKKCKTITLSSWIVVLVSQKSMIYSYFKLCPEAKYQTYTIVFTGMGLFMSWDWTRPLFWGFFSLSSSMQYMGMGGLWRAIPHVYTFNHS